MLAAAGVASAQSSVTLFGVVDANLQHTSGSGSPSKTQLTQGGHSFSRVGFRGTEDLGGGMSASFWLEAGFQLDNGAGFLTSTNNQGFNGSGNTGGGGLTFNRRSTVSLSSGLGELRLGRDLTLQTVPLYFFDPFLLVGSGGSEAYNGQIRFTGATAVRASNSISYILPGKLGGFYGQFQHYLGENNQTGAATEDDGTGTGIKLGWANGPIDVAVVTSRTEFATTATAGDIRSSILGASYDFGVAKAMATVTHERVDSITSATGKGALIGAVVPVGAGRINVSYSRYETDRAGTPESKKFALGYVYNLSKRTLLYTTVGRVTNSGGANSSPDISSGVVTAANARSTGYDFGIKHSF